MNRNAWIATGIIGAIVVIGGVAWYSMTAQRPAITNQPAINEPVTNEPVIPGGTALNPASQIKVTSPQPDEIISSPLTVTGEARGTWYFEASFPVKLLDANGNIIAQKPAQAMGDWMTEDFVPFQITLTFDKPTTETGTLILEKDNPSGLPQNANQLVIPVRFTASKQIIKNGCIVSGCSGEVCANEEMVSTCIYNPEYACYKLATCEKQSDGNCDWTQNIELQQCIASNQK